MTSRTPSENHTLATFNVKRVKRVTVRLCRVLVTATQRPHSKLRGAFIYFLQVVNCIVNYLEVLKLFLNKIHVNLIRLFHIADALFEPTQIKATNGILCILINASHTNYTI